MSDRTITRRRALAGLTGAGIAGLAGCAGPTGGEDASGTVSIGVLQPLSGDLAYYGNHSMWGFLTGLAQKGDTEPVETVETGTETVSVGDVDYELLIRDTGFSPDEAQTLAEGLVADEDVDMLFGCSSSGSARRVITTVAKEAEVPYMVGPAAATDLTASSEFCGEQIFRASENTAMDARSGGRYVAQETDVSRVYLFGADYSFGQSVVNNYRQVLESEGVEIVGERFVPRGFSEWDGLLENAEEEGAEGIVGGFTVQTLPALFTSFLGGDYSYRLFGGFATRITNGIVGQVLQQSLGELTEETLSDVAIGPFTTRYHWNQYDNEINTEFVETYTDTYGNVPDLFSSGTFTAASAIVQAVEQEGSTDPDDIVAGLTGMSVDETPKGEGAYTFQEYNNQARSPMTVADVVPTADEFAETWGASIQPSEPLATVGADQVTRPASDVDCSL